MTQRQRQLIILIFAALLLIVGLVLVIVVLMNPDFLSRPTVSRFIIDQPRQLGAHVEHTLVSGHLECSGKTSLSEMQVVVYVRGIKPEQEKNGDAVKCHV